MQVSEVQLVRDCLGLHSSTLWALTSSKTLYEGFEASTSSFENYRDMTIPRQFQLQSDGICAPLCKIRDEYKKIPLRD